ncbi:uncharacterized protein LOC144116263 isoform X1 [Amblyomma americanum]
MAGVCCLDFCLPGWCLRRLPGRRRPRASGAYRSHAPVPGAMPGVMPSSVPGGTPYDPPPPYSPNPPKPCQTAQPMGHPSRLYPTPGQPYPTPAPGPYPMASYPQQPGLPQQTMYHVPDVFDAGARFTHNKPAIPPPPPGVPPNAAQLAAMQGNPVVLGQKKSNFWTTGAGGGYTFW